MNIHKIIKEIQEEIIATHRNEHYVSVIRYVHKKFIKPVIEVSAGAYTMQYNYKLHEATLFVSLIKQKDLYEQYTIFVRDLIDILHIKNIIEMVVKQYNTVLIFDKSINGPIRTITRDLIIYNGYINESTGHLDKDSFTTFNDTYSYDARICDSHMYYSGLAAKIIKHDENFKNLYNEISAIITKNEYLEIDNKPMKYSRKIKPNEKDTAYLVCAFIYGVNNLEINKIAKSIGVTAATVRSYISKYKESHDDVISDMCERKSITNNSFLEKQHKELLMK